ncbi:chemotaxis response regulator protein-glutamate methylesterase [Cohnella endophytica]|uniref:Protein-glutamate methylesterase/protein-glutamine glutaminase n=1 Tax=Cohnella endophytica TaxID=2419778 RepID=A0A494XJE8_9BACL|nr:chemotaxis response regulator protein-glutamate methylesterase [Cohnella endophytica]RKP49892.1 chemotaxis response regulator protein-glutamate methylesterase [Cohnella endophytica]
MHTPARIKVLVVDDSNLFREVLSRAFSLDPAITVVATAADPFEARDKILEHHPDVMTCDVEMPRMNGIEFIRRLLPQYAIPVIVVSSVSEAVFDAMSAGAVDFVTKPDMKSPQSLPRFIQELIVKIKIASKSKVLLNEPAASDTKNPIEVRSEKTSLIAIGASTGGTEAIYAILKNLPPTLPGIVIVQHIPPVFSRMFADRLNAQTSLQVKEARTGDYVKPGCVYIAPGDRHLKVKRMGTEYRLECYEGEKVNGHCPSVDVLFDSVAKEAGDSAIGVLLTGMGYDGARGLLVMRRKGARTIGQDEQSSVVYGMPRVAYDIGAVEKQVPLTHIPQLLRSLSSQA